MENNEQKLKMLVTAIDNETKRAESIEAAIDKVSGELTVLKEEFERKHSEALERYMRLCAASGNAKKYIENCKKELAELTAGEPYDTEMFFLDYEEYFFREKYIPLEQS